ncbi:hypothetical protein [Streptomyces sp. SP18CS02]|uniref:hypothetical protein n=1 Tax=Streptomyces sp. SP18CS02 TaxID=3002531 RepID=UPI002E7A3741|nr:hypothetical protein [Streptomyces sp. SP18CS02]MEE1756250.1 hypothetical protein [Streptomyces sp. SP18CS02]
MSRHDRKEDEVRRMLDTPRPQVPPDLLPRALARGTRALLRARARRRLMWLTLAAGMLAFVVWASVAQPWQAPPSGLTPPFEGW